MRYLRKNTAVIVTVGPFYDKTDGVTIENSLTITNERISLTVDADNGDAPTLVLDNVTGATSGTSNDLNYISGCDAGLMQLELAAANVNYNGRALLTITDAANHVPVFHEFMILPANVYDSLVSGSDSLEVDTTAISGDTTAADNCELMFDGTGYAGGTTKLGVDAVAISGDATAADNAESFFDGTGYAGTNNVIPTVTTLTNLPAITSNWLTATGIASGAITNAKFAAGAIDATAIANGAIDAATFAAGAIDATAIADNAIDLATFAADVKTGSALKANVETITNNAITAASINSGAITNAKFAAGAIDATAIANGAIDAATFAADVDAEAAAWIWGATDATLSLTYAVIADRIYQMVNNRMTVNESTGAVALRNIGNSGDIATGNVASSSGTTTRAELSWS